MAAAAIDDLVAVMTGSLLDFQADAAILRSAVGP
jgi:hypothetical protein